MIEQAAKGTKFGKFVGYFILFIEHYNFVFFMSCKFLAKADEIFEFTHRRIKKSPDYFWQALPMTIYHISVYMTLDFIRGRENYLSFGLCFVHKSRIIITLTPSSIPAPCLLLF